MKYLRWLTVLFLLPVAFMACRNTFSPAGQPDNALYRLAVSREISNGKITIKDDIKTATKGTPITLSIEPAVYFQLATLEYFTNGNFYDIYSNYDELTQTCVFAMPGGDTEIYGTFQRYIRKINVFVDPPGSAAISTSPANNASPEEEVTVNLSVNPGYRLVTDREKGFESFFSLSDQGQINWLDAPNDSFYMPDSNITINALSERVYSIEVLGTRDEDDNAIASIILRDGKGVRRTEFSGGENVSVSINMLDTYWTLDTLTADLNTLGSNEDGEVSGGFTMPYGDVTLTAAFVPNPNNLYTITVESGIANGSITPVTINGTYRPRAYAKEIVYLNIQPTPGYKVDDLIVTNAFDGEDIEVFQPAYSRPYFVMPFRSVSIDGSFIIRDLELTGAVSPSGSGTVSFENSGGTSISTARMNETVVVLPIANANYRLRNNGVSYSYTDENSVTSTIPLAAPYRIQTMPPYSINATAQFERVYRVAKNINTALGTLTIARAGGAEADEFTLGEQVYVYIGLLDEDNYTIDTVSFTSGGETYPITDMFTMPRNDVTVNVTFRATTMYKVRAEAGIVNGSVLAETENGSSLLEAPAGGLVYLNVLPNPGYGLDTLRYRINTGSYTPIDTTGYPAVLPSFVVPAMSDPSDTVNVHATFKKIDLDLVGVVDPTGAGTVVFENQGGVQITKAQAGDTITVKVAPAAGSKYRVKANGVSYSYNAQTNQLSGSSPYTFTMPSYPTTVNAQFELLHQVSKYIAPEDSTKGTLTITRQGGFETDQFAAGETVRVYTEVTDSNYIIDAVRVSGAMDAIISDRFTMPAGDVTVSVTFRISSDIVYRVAAAGSITNGSVSPESFGGNYLSEAAVGERVYLNIRPAPGYELDKANLRYRINNTGTYYTIDTTGYPATTPRPSFAMPTMANPTDSITISASFVLKDLSLSSSVTPSAGGTLSLSKTTAKMGDSITATVTANPNYRLRANGVTYLSTEAGAQPVTLQGSYTFAMPAYDVEVKAEFDQLYTVSASVSPAGSGTVAFRNSANEPVTQFAVGDTVNITAAGGIGFALLSLSANRGVGTISGNSFTMPSGGNVTVTATFSKIEYTVTPVSVANGSFSVPGKATYDQMVTVTPQASPGYELSDLYYNAGAGNVTVYPSLSFPMPAANITVGGSFALRDLTLNSGVTPSGSGNVAFTNKGGGSSATAKLGETISVSVTSSNTSLYRIKSNGVSYSYTNGAGLQTVQLGGTSPYSFNMPAYNTTVNAEFDHLYTVSSSVASGSGTVSFTNSNNSPATLFVRGERVNVITTPASGYIVESISVTNLGLISGSFFNMPIEGDVTVSVSFVQDPTTRYQVKVNATSNGSVTPESLNGNYLSDAAVGERVYLNIQPAPGYELNNSSLNYRGTTGPVVTIDTTGYPVTTPRPSFLMPSMSNLSDSITISASFVLKDLSLSSSVTPSGGGSVSLSKTTAKMGDAITATVTANPNYRLKANGVTYLSAVAGAQPITLQAPYAFNMPAYNVEVKADFDQLYTVSASVSPAGSGTVAFRNSDNEPATQFAVGDTVNVTATGNTGYALAGMSANRGVGTISGNSFTMPSGGDVTVTVTFSKIEYTLLAISVANGSFTVPGKATYGDTVTVTPQSSAGYELSDLYYNVGSTTVTVYPSLSFPMPASNITVGGLFGLKDLNLTSSVTPSGSGAVAFTNKGGGSTATAKLGDPISVSVTSLNSSLYRIKSNGVSYSYTNGSGLQTVQLGGTSPYSFTMPAYNTAVNAEFERLYSVTPSVSPVGSGTVTFRNAANEPADLFAAGETVTIIAEPGTGYRLDSMSASGTVTISGSSFTMPGNNVTVTAAFTKQQYAISVLRSDNGDINAVPQSATMGEQVTLNAQPAAGYKLATLEYNDGTGYKTIPISSPSFTMPAQNVTVRGSFTLRDLDLTSSMTPAGVGTVTFTNKGGGSTATAMMGDTISVAVAPNDNLQYRVRGNGVSYNYTNDAGAQTVQLAGTSPYSFTMPAYDTSVNAVFDRLYTVTCTIVPAGAGTALIKIPGGDESSLFAQGDQVEIIPESAAGYLGGAISIGGVPQGRIFTMPGQNTNVTVTFEKESYTVSVQLPANGNISASRLSATMGDTVTLTVQPSPGYEYRVGSLSAGAGVTIAMNGYPANTNARPSFAMPARNVTVSGAFDKKTLSLTGTVTPAGGGTVALTPSTGTAQVGDPVSVTVTPATDPNKYRLRSSGVSYNYNDASGGAISVVLNSPYSFNMPGYDTVVRAEFERLYTVSPASDPAIGGTVEFRNAGGAAVTDFAQGDTVNVLATPAQGYQLVNVSVSGGMGVLSGSSFTMPGRNVTVTATFEKQKYTAYAVSDGNGHLYLYPPGAVTGSSIAIAEMDDKITLEITPAEGYEFDEENLYCRTSEMTNVPILKENGQYYFIMPASDVTVVVVFDSRTFNLTTEVIREPGDSSSTIALSTNTPQAGERIVVTVTPQIGYELKSLMYYLPGSSEGVDIDRAGVNYAFFITTGVENGATVHIVAVFGIISHKLVVEPGSSDGGTFSIYLGSGSTQINSASYNDLITVYLVEKAASGYGYKDGSFKVYTISGAPVPLTSAVKDTLVSGRYVFKFNMPNSSVIISAEYDRFKYNLSPATVSNGTVKSISQVSSVPMGTYITFTAEPDEGYRVLSAGFSLRNGSTQVKSSSGFTATGNPNQFGFDLTFTVTPVPANNASLTVSAQFALDSFSLSRDPGTTGALITFSHSGNVLYGTTVTVTVARSYSERYIPGSVKLNNGDDDACFLTPEVKNLDGTYTRTFRMPAKTIVVSAASEPIPQAVVDINDPNMDKYIHFLDATNSVEIEYAGPPGREITVEAYKPAYYGAPPDEIEIIPLTVQSWWLDSVIQSGLGPNPRTFTIPDPCYARIVTAMVTIGGKPHSVSIPIRQD